MPGEYQVQNRGAPTARAGLALPFPPTQGPLVLQPGNAGLRYRAMGQIESGNVQAVVFPGLWTDSISDCVVLAAVEWDLAQNTWTNFCWQHLRGGLYKDWRDEFRQQIGMAANCFGLIASRDWIGTSVLFDKMVNWGIPPGQMSVYISRHDFKFGLRFYGGAFGEV